MASALRIYKAPCPGAPPPGRALGSARRVGTGTASCPLPRLHSSGLVPREARMEKYPKSRKRLPFRLRLLSGGRNITASGSSSRKKLRDSGNFSKKLFHLGSFGSVLPEETPSPPSLPGDCNAKSLWRGRNPAPSNGPGRSLFSEPVHGISGFRG